MQNEIIIERDPKRVIQIQNPKEYDGAYGDKGTNEQGSGEKNFFVNGIFNVVDGAFLSGFFVSEIKNTNCIVGPYPLYEIDVE